MLQCYLVRHGQSEHHVQDLTGGWSESRLTDRGRLQARLTGRQLAQRVQPGLLRAYTAELRRSPHVRVPPDAWPTCQLYCSDLDRALETAALVGEATGLTPRPHPGLRELNNGEAANCTHQEAREMRLPMTEPRQIWVPYPGAESWATMNTRIYQTMDEIDADVPHTAIIVGHSLAGNSIIHWWLALCDDCQSRVAYRLQPGGITRLGLNVWDERTIWLLNDTCHLQDTHC